ncbi:MAG: hypothetical protein P1V81_06930 [Planctomycetota bacterium]|nr:hypothetical protein [Planctomycetota bacterium]
MSKENQTGDPRTKGVTMSDGRQEILELAKVQHPENTVECPLCKTGLKARNLVRHYDRQHKGQPVPTKQEGNEERKPTAPQPNAPQPAAPSRPSRARSEIQPCTELLALAGPRLYRNNMFRVLGLQVSSSASEVRKREKRMEMERKLGLDSSSTTINALELDPEPESEVRARAVERMSEPVARFLDEFFWVWPLAGSGTLDGPIAALERGDLTAAMKAWRGVDKGSEAGAVAQRNLAVIHHLRALDAELAIVEGDDGEIDRRALKADWKSALQLWFDASLSEDLWARSRERVRELNDQVLTTGFVRRVRESLPLALVSINVQLALDAAERGDASSVARQMALMSEMPFGQECNEQALQAAIKPIRDRIKTYIEAAKGRWTAKPPTGNEAVRDLHAQASKQLAVVDALLSAGHPARSGLHDMVAEAMLGGQIAYLQKTAAWDESISLLVLAKETAAGAVTRNNLQENIDVLQRERDLGNDWYSPGYWDLPEETVEAVEVLHGELKAGNLAKTIKGLIENHAAHESGGPLLRCLAHALSLHGIQQFNEGYAQYDPGGGMLEGLLDKLRGLSETQLHIALSTYPSPTDYSVPKCLNCGRKDYTSWNNFTFKDIELFWCIICQEKYESSVAKAKAQFKPIIVRAYEYVQLADELDPNESGIVRNLGNIKGMLVDFGARPSSTKRLRKSLGMNSKRKAKASRPATTRPGSVTDAVSKGTGSKSHAALIGALVGLLAFAVSFFIPVEGTPLTVIQWLSSQVAEFLELPEFPSSTNQNVNFGVQAAIFLAFWMLGAGIGMLFRRAPEPGTASDGEGGGA